MVENLHAPIHFSDLRGDILGAMEEDHTLKSCPRCGNVLTEFVCHKGIRPDVPVAVLDPSKIQHANCNFCGVVWALWCRDISNDGNEGSPNYWEGHQLFLSAISNCFCRASVLNKTRFHESKNGYSRVRLSATQRCRG